MTPPASQRPVQRTCLGSTVVSPDDEKFLVRASRALVTPRGNVIRYQQLRKFEGGAALAFVDIPESLLLSKTCGSRLDRAARKITRVSYVRKEVVRLGPARRDRYQPRAGHNPRSRGQCGGETWTLVVFRPRAKMKCHFVQVRAGI